MWWQMPCLGFSVCMSVNKLFVNVCFEKNVHMLTIFIFIFYRSVACCDIAERIVRCFSFP